MQIVRYIFMIGLLVSPFVFAQDDADTSDTSVNAVSTQDQQEEQISPDQTNEDQEADTPATEAAESAEPEETAMSPQQTASNEAESDDTSPAREEPAQEQLSAIEPEAELSSEPSQEVQEAATSEEEQTVTSAAEDTEAIAQTTEDETSDTSDAEAMPSVDFGLSTDESRDDEQSMEEAAPERSEQIPPVPTLVQEKEPEEEDVEIVGIDTTGVDESKGNWLFKRIWFEKAQKVYEKIKEVVTNTFDTRLSFFEQRAQLDRTLFDPFYLEIGISQGELSETVQYFLDQLQRDREREGSLGDEERSFAVRLAEEKKSLEQLKVDVDAVAKLDQAINNALQELLNQMNRARGFERQAWDALKAITQELSDKKAREYYYTMRNMLQNCKSVFEYVSQSFSQYFEQIIAQAQEKVSAVKQQIEVLKQKGIDLKEQANRLQEGEPEPAPVVEPEQEEEEAPAPVKSTGFFATIFNGIGSFFYSIGSGIAQFFATIFEWIGIKSKPPVVSPEVMEEEEPIIPASQSEQESAA